MLDKNKDNFKRNGILTLDYRLPVPMFFKKALIYFVVPVSFGLKGVQVLGEYSVVDESDCRHKKNVPLAYRQ